MTKQDPEVTEEQAPEATESGRKKLLADRRRKLDRLRDEFGLDPYGQRIDGLISLAEARAAYDEAADEAHRAADAAVREAKKAGTPEDQWPAVPDDRAVVSVAGRVMQHRVMGNLIFMSLRDDTADVQVAISKRPWVTRVWDRQGNGPVRHRRRLRCAGQNKHRRTHRLGNGLLREAQANIS